MHVYRINKPLFELPADHPARQFLEAFVRCRESCIGQELLPPFGKDIDQEWWSTTDNQKYRYSGFAYAYLAFDVKLDGWLTDAPKRTESETVMLESLPHMQSLMAECKEAAKSNDNQPIVEITEAVLEMLTLWKKCIEFRIEH